jgi:GGDEF domain-containing protein
MDALPLAPLTASSFNPLLLAALVLLLAASGWVWWQRRRRATPAAEAAAAEPVELHDRLLSAQAFERALDTAVLRHGQTEQAFAVLAVDLARLGGPVRLDEDDHLLHELMGRLPSASAGLRAATLAAPDRLALLWTCAPADAMPLARSLLDTLARPVHRGGQPALSLMPSLGLTLYPQHGARHLLLSHAITAMVAVKQAGGGAVALYEPRVASEAAEQAALLAAWPPSLQVQSLAAPRRRAADHNLH